MKKHLLLWILVLSLLMTACGQTAPAETGMDARSILRVMLEAAPEPEDSYAVYDFGEDDSLVMLEFLYSISREEVEDSAFAQANGASAFEVMVFCLAEDTDADRAAACCQNRLIARQGDFTGYAPDQAALAENGVVLSAGRWMALVISEDTDAVKAAFESCFSEGAAQVSVPVLQLPDTIPDGRLAYIDPEIDDMTLYDTSAILAAWESGDRSSLSPKDAAILEAAEMVLEQELTDGMSDREKELALYTWLTSTVDYDWDHQNDPQNMHPDSGNPYGGLVRRTAICLGFATTFQLLMDMADVECITVVGAAFNSREDHAWNMVRLDGEWYCADATWDMGCSPEYFSYFNVTSDWMAMTDHQWDYSAVPEATAEEQRK